MSAIRISVPGQPTRFIDLGGSVGRRTMTRGPVYGGVLVVSQPALAKPPSPESLAKHKAANARYFEAKQRRKAVVPCGRWIILSRSECVRHPRHRGECQPAESAA